MQASLHAKQRGVILLIVVISLTLLAALGFLLSRQGAINTGGVVREHQPNAARYLAEAGMNHARWQLNRNSCTGYSNLTDVPLGSHKYSATISPTSGSPVSITVVGTHLQGASHTIQRERIKIFQTPNILVLQPNGTTGKDTYIYQWKATWNYGQYSQIWTEYLWSDSKSHTLLQFDLSNVPPNVNITSAVLELYQNSPSANSGTVSAHRITQQWNEGVNSGAQGAANWTQRDAGSNWITPGGDFESTAVATKTIVAGLKTWYGWEIKALIQNWLDGKYPNYGVLLNPAWGTAAYFYSSDYSDPAYHPKLTIQYACECGQTCSDSCTGVFADKFQTASFANNDGTRSWAGNWLELDDAGAGPGTGKVMITGGELRLNGPVLALVDFVTGAAVYYPSITREADLSSFQSATLTFKFRTGSGVDIGVDSAVVEISKDGGVSWHVLENFVNAGPNASAERSYDISAHLSTNTRIRFRINADYSQANEYFFVDNLAISASCNSPGITNTVLMVVNDASNPSLQDEAKKNLLNSWGYQTRRIDDNDSKAAFDTALGSANVVYVTLQADAAVLGDKLRTAPIGVVSENAPLAPSLGLAANSNPTSLRSTINVLNNSHVLTSPWPTGSVNITSSDQPMIILGGQKAPDIQILADAMPSTSAEMLAVVDKDGALYGGGVAKARIVQLPWGSAGFDINALNAEGQGLMKRAIEWGYVDNVAPPVDTTQTVVLPASADVYIDEALADSNFGANVSFFAGFDNGRKHRRALLKFDLTGIPAGATVNQVTLRLYSSTVSGSPSLGVYRIVTVWNENTATWTNMNGDANYNWTQLATGTPSTGWVAWTLPNGLVHEWLDGVSPNHGVVLRYEGNQRNNMATFVSKENSAADQRPQLVVKFTPP